MRTMEMLQHFQQALDRVAATGNREEIDARVLPDVKRWGGLESHNCTICVDHGQWWILPPGTLTHPGTAA